MRFNSIRARMTLTFALGIALLMLLVCGGLALYARVSDEQNADTLLDTAAQKVAAALHADQAQGGHEELREEEQQDLKVENIALQIVDAQGRVLEQSQRNVPPWPRKDDAVWRVRTLPFGTTTIIVGLPWQQTLLSLHRLTLSLLALGLLATVAAAIGAWLLVGRTLSPIGLLSRQAQTASADSLDIRLNAPSADVEMVELVTTLNGLLARLAEAAAAKGRFHAAASHELRTPLQALSGHLELALHRRRTEEEYHAVVEEAHKQTRRLISLARDLLLLSQLDSARTPPQEAVCLTDVCADALHSFAPLIAAHSLRVEAHLPSGATVQAVPTHAEMLTRNLIENAIKYASEGGTVRIGVTGPPDATLLTIFNTCPSLPDWNPDKLFEPFYRPDASRNSQTGGAGLGLAICKAIATKNGWQLTLQQTAEGVMATVLFASLQPASA
jgi:signal transduction histidine kinase